MNRFSASRNLASQQTGPGKVDPSDKPVRSTGYAGTDPSKVASGEKTEKLAVWNSVFFLPKIQKISSLYSDNYFRAWRQLRDGCKSHLSFTIQPKPKLRYRLACERKMLIFSKKLTNTGNCRQNHFLIVARHFFPLCRRNRRFRVSSLFHSDRIVIPSV